MYRVSVKANALACALAAFLTGTAAIAQEAENKSTFGEIIDLLKEWAKTSGTSEEALGDQIARALKNEDSQGALDAVLKQRESWGTEPSKPSNNASQPGQADNSQTEDALKDLLKQRAAWSGATAETQDGGEQKERMAATASKPCQPEIDKVLSTNAIGFQPSSAKYTKTGGAAIDKVASILKDCGATEVTIEGHTDSSGRKAANELLSRDRAGAVAKALREKGLAKLKIKSVGLGSSKPVAPNDTAENKAKNRRIVVTVTAAGQDKSDKPAPKTTVSANSDNQATLKALIAQREALAARYAGKAAPDKKAKNKVAAKQADATPDERSALEQLLAERASWGKKPSISSAQLVAQAHKSSATPTPAAKSKEKTKSAAAKAPQPQHALKRLLAERESWGTKPSLSSADIAAATEPSARSAKSTGAAKPESKKPNTSPKTATPTRAEIDAALAKHLEMRKNWGAKSSAGTPRKSVALSKKPAAPARKDDAKTSLDPLKDLLAQREAWASAKPKPAATSTAAVGFTSKPNKLGAPPVDEALAALLAERECWRKDGKNCAQSAKPATRTAALDTKSKATAKGPALSPSACQGELDKVLTPGWITFEPDSSAFGENGRKALRKAAGIIQRCNNIAIRIEGHTDASGNASANKRLSLRRANAVASYLGRAGIDRQQLKTAGLGASKPIAPNDTAENKAKNRRIEVKILSK